MKIDEMEAGRELDASERRLLNVMEQLLRGDCFVTGGRPKVSRPEIREIERRLGVTIWVETTTVAYPVDHQEFAQAYEAYVTKLKAGEFMIPPDRLKEKEP